MNAGSWIRIERGLSSLFLFLALLLLSIKIKTPGFETIRPTYYTGIFALFCAALYFAPRNVRMLLQLQKSAVVLIVILSVVYLYMLAQAVPMPMRAVKDVILGASVDVGLLLLLLGHHGLFRDEGRDAVNQQMIVMVWLGMLAGLYAWAVYLGAPGLKVGDYDFSHNPVWTTRIHGWFGEPTHLGAAAAFSALAGVYLFASGSSARIQALVTSIVLILLGAMLYGAGTRNGLLSAFVGTGVMLIVWQDRRLRVAAAAVLIFGGGLVATSAAVNIAGGENEHIQRLEKRFAAQSSSSIGERSGLSFSDVHFTEAFRLADPGGALERVERFKRALMIYAELDGTEKLIGAGYGYTRDVYRSPLNDYLESLVDFGVAYVVLIVGYFVFMQYLLLCLMRSNTQRDREYGVLGTGLLAFSATFALNQSALFSEFFHFAHFANLLVAAMLVSRFAGRWQPTFTPGVRDARLGNFGMHR